MGNPQIVSFIFQEIPSLRKYLDNDEYDRGLKNLGPHPTESEIVKVAKGAYAENQVELLEHIVLCKECAKTYGRHYKEHPRFRTF